MALDDLVDVFDRIHELDEVFPPMIGERDFVNTICTSPSFSSWICAP
jgi:hypothetical protein